MKSCVIFALAAVAIASSHIDEDFAEEYDLLQDIPAEEDLMSAVHEMRRFAPMLLQEHVKVVAHHAELIQDSKAKAYAHDFTKSQAAIKAAIKSLNAELQAGHDHDVDALRTSKNSGNKIVNDADAAAKTRVREYRDRACPTKRTEEAADSKKQAAKKKMDGIADSNICGGLSTTWGDMDIDKTTAKYGTALRNGWDKVRADYVKARTAHEQATKEHNDAIAAHQRSMAGFTTALGIEAQNVVDTCNAAHKQYDTLVKDVQSNVNMRKQTYVAGLVIQCYVDNITSNSGAKKCADGARSADVSRWNIDGGKLGACASNAANQNSYGPKDWKATSTNCKGHKSSVAKENAFKEKENKAAAKKAAEKSDKKAAELKTKEGAAKSKEKADKKKEKDAKAAAKEKESKAAEKKSKADAAKAAELKTKETAAKKKAKDDHNKHVASVRSSFKCTGKSSSSNNAGVVKAGAASGYVMTGGGMNQRLRTWKQEAAFEEAFPSGNHYQCDTGFGPGQVTCYSQSCYAKGGLSCGTKSARFTGSGSKTVNAPAGYVMTGGGMYNHYRTWNKKAGFEESRPEGNGWKGDMGFGWGDYTVYVRYCKAPTHTSLSCKTVSARNGNAFCAAGYQLTSCGIFNHWRDWNVRSGVENWIPNGNRCQCDFGFGAGNYDCYARCCKLA